MNKLILAFLLSASCSAEQPGYPWFEGEWISDAESSLAINPEYAELDEETLQIVREMYRQVRWTIHGNLLKYVDDRYNQYVELEMEFTIVPIDSESFQLDMADEKRDVWKTESGFCTDLSQAYISEHGLGKNGHPECFKLHGT